MQAINKKYLKSLSPCSDRYKNYLTHYSNFSGSFIEFLQLNMISFDDKLFVAKHILTKSQSVRWAIYCAESVLHLYENLYPDRYEVRAAIDAVIIFEADPTDENQTNSANAAHAAAHAANAVHAAHAANAAHAAHAAAFTAAYTYANAVHAANAAHAAYYSDTRNEKQTELIELLVRAIQEVE